VVYLWSSLFEPNPASITKQQNTKQPKIDVSLIFSSFVLQKMGRAAVALVTLLALISGGNASNGNQPSIKVDANDK
jgi:hypothetical protein